MTSKIWWLAVACVLFAHVAVVQASDHDDIHRAGSGLGPRLSPTSYGLHQKGLERVDSTSGVAPLVIDGALQKMPNVSASF